MSTDAPARPITDLNLVSDDPFNIQHQTDEQFFAALELNTAPVPPSRREISLTRRPWNHPFKVFTLDNFGIGHDLPVAMTSIFAPLLRKTINISPRVNRVSISSFKSKLKIDSDALTLLDEMKSAGLNFVLAGGKMIDYCMNEQNSQNDFDIFFTSQVYLDDAKKYLLRNGFDLLSEKGHVIEYFNVQRQFKVQLVKSIFASQEAVICSFDLRLCAVAYDGNKVYWVDGALKDIKDKQIVVQVIRPIKTCFIRVMKYVGRGFEIKAPDLALTAISFLSSMDRLDAVTHGYFTDREYLYNSALEQSEYDFTGTPPIIVPVLDNEESIPF